MHETVTQWGIQWGWVDISIRPLSLSIVIRWWWPRGLLLLVEIFIWLRQNYQHLFVGEFIFIVQLNKKKSSRWEKRTAFFSSSASNALHPFLLRLLEAHGTQMRGQIVQLLQLIHMICYSCPKIKHLRSDRNIQRSPRIFVLFFKLLLNWRLYSYDSIPFCSFGGPRQLVLTSYQMSKTTYHFSLVHRLPLFIYLIFWPSWVADWRFLEALPHLRSTQ